MAQKTQRDTVRLCLLGFGNVGRALCELIADREDELTRGFGVRYAVTAIGTRHGSPPRAPACSSRAP